MINYGGIRPSVRRPSDVRPDAAEPTSVRRYPSVRPRPPRRGARDGYLGRIGGGRVVDLHKINKGGIRPSSLARHGDGGGAVGRSMVIHEC